MPNGSTGQIFGQCKSKLAMNMQMDQILVVRQVMSRVQRANVNRVDITTSTLESL